MIRPEMKPGEERDNAYKLLVKESELMEAMKAFHPKANRIEIELNDDGETFVKLYVKGQDHPWWDTMFFFNDKGDGPFISRFTGDRKADPKTWYTTEQM